MVQVKWMTVKSELYGLLPHLDSQVVVLVHLLFLTTPRNSTRLVSCPLAHPPNPLTQSLRSLFSSVVMKHTLSLRPALSASPCHSSSPVATVLSFDRPRLKIPGAKMVDCDFVSVPWPMASCCEISRHCAGPVTLSLILLPTHSSFCRLLVLPHSVPVLDLTSSL